MVNGAIILSLPIITLATLGVLFLVNKPRDRHNFQFSVIAFSLGIWVASNYLADYDSSNSLLWTRLAFFSVTIASGTFLLFALSYSRRSSKFKLFSNIVKMITLFVAILSLTNWVIPEVYYEDNISNVKTGSLYLLFVAFFASAMICAMYTLFRTRHKVKGKERQQIGIILFGVILMTAAGSVTNLIAPFLTGTNPLATLGSFSTVFFVGATYYAIAQHKFLDIKLVVVRSMAYVMSVGTMLLIYIALVFGSTSLFLSNSTISNSQRLIYAVFAVLIATTFQPLKNFFDKLTDKIFYRSKYDPEQLLSEYSDFLVDEIDTNKVINKTLSLMDEVANPTNALVVLYREGAAVWHDINGPIYADDKEELAKALEYQSAPVFVADQARIHEDPFTENIKDRMLNTKLEVSVRLSTHGQLEGFIVLGDKKSGTRYNQKDLGFFVTVANELSVTIQNSQRFDQIQRFNVTLQREVEEATARLKQTNEKLKQLDVAKDEFISMASHQLRTPLTSVKGYLSMVMDGDAGKINKEQTKLLSEAFSSSQRMVYLIADLLNVSRLKTGKFVIEPARVDLPVVVQEEVDQLTPTASTRQILIKYSKPSSFPEMFIDETKTRQVIMNFIDNAIYYTQGGGEIKVTLMAKKDHIEYRVIDSGIGIPTAEQHKLFTKFFRASNAKRARPDGTGLGLYMAQKIISAQDGSVTFKSTEGKGSTFGFNLPIKPIETTDTDEE